MFIEHIAFNIPNVREAVPWYIEHCAMQLLRAIPDDPYIHFLTDSRGTIIEFYSNKAVALIDYDELNPLKVHLAMVVDDMEATITRLTTAGATLTGDPYIATYGDKLAFLRDPWNFPLQLVQRITPLV